MDKKYLLKLIVISVIMAGLTSGLLHFVSGYSSVFPDSSKCLKYMDRELSVSKFSCVEHYYPLTFFPNYVSFDVENGWYGGQELWLGEIMAVIEYIVLYYILFGVIGLVVRSHSKSQSSPKTSTDVPVPAPVVPDKKNAFRAYMSEHWAASLLLSVPLFLYLVFYSTIQCRGGDGFGCIVFFFIYPALAIPPTIILYTLIPSNFALKWRFALLILIQIIALVFFYFYTIIVGMSESMLMIWLFVAGVVISIIIIMIYYLAKWVFRRS